ncbi:MAG: cytochrome b N-terminal domain-containing protein [Candidatus Aminicenantia bacterium]
MSLFKRIIDWLEKRINLSEIFSFFSAFGLYYGEIDTRDPIEVAIKKASSQELPPYGKWPHILGILTFLLFIFEVLTGLLLAFYYQPVVHSAYESTREIVRDVRFGWLFFNIHRWGADLLILLLIFRIVRFFYHRVWRNPRELFWIIGIFILMISICSFISGKLLPYDQNSYWTTVRNLEIIGKIPIVSSFFNFLIGGSIITDVTFSRFYFLHIVTFPLLLWILFYLHFSTVRRVGLSEVESKRGEEVTFYPSHIFSLFLAFFLLIFILVSLSVLLPSKLDIKADSFKTPSGIGPSWFFLPLIPLVEHIPYGFGGLIVLLILIFLLLFPFIGEKFIKGRVISSILTIIFLISLFNLNILGV